MLRRKQIVTCRLCGSDKPLTVCLDQPFNGFRIKLRDIIVDLIKPTELVDIPNLSQNICVACAEFADSYLKFCGRVAKHQEVLAKSTVAESQEELDERIFNASELELTKETEILLDRINLSVEQLVTLENDIDDLSTIDQDDMSTTEQIQNFEPLNGPEESCGEETADGHRFNLRNKIPPATKECSISLERLPIVFVKSDTESDTDSSDDDHDSRDVNTTPKANKKRRLRSTTPSPAKRMRICSPLKVSSNQISS